MQPGPPRARWRSRRADRNLSASVWIALALHARCRLIRIGGWWVQLRRRSQPLAFAGSRVLSGLTKARRQGGESVRLAGTRNRMERELRFDGSRKGRDIAAKAGCGGSHAGKARESEMTSETQI